MTPNRERIVDPRARAYSPLMLITPGYKPMWILMFAGVGAALAVMLAAQSSLAPHIPFIALGLGVIMFALAVWCVIAGLRMSKKGQNRAAAINIVIGSFAILSSGKFVLSTLLQLLP